VAAPAREGQPSRVIALSLERPVSHQRGGYHQRVDRSRSRCYALSTEVGDRGQKKTTQRVGKGRGDRDKSVIILSPCSKALG